MNTTDCGDTLFTIYMYARTGAKNIQLKAYVPFSQIDTFNNKLKQVVENMMEKGRYQEALYQRIFQLIR